jgi:hypothetical protein
VPQHLLDRHLAAERGEVQRPMFAARHVGGCRVGWGLGVASRMDRAASCLAHLLPPLAGLFELPVPLGVDHRLQA